MRTYKDAYWKANYASRPYVEKGTTYDTYRPAYQYGWESRARHSGRQFDAVEADLEKEWRSKQGQSKLGWEKANLAARDAWDHVERALPGDADGDGK